MTLIRMTELRSAARGLARNPTVALSAVLCLSLGIGATAAISSAISRALVQSLPFRDADRLVAVFRTTPQTGPQGTWPHSAPNYVDLARGTRRLSALAALTPGTALVNLGDNGVQASQLRVTGNLFDLLGVSAQLGRLVLPTDDQLDQPPVVVLSDEFWRNAFGGDRSIIGRRLTVDGQPTTVIGVAPRDFRLPMGPQVLRADLWLPIRFTPAQRDSRGNNFLWLVGRLASGATPEAAQVELRGLFAGLVAEHPSLRSETIRAAALQPESVASIRAPLLLLFGAVCTVLLIATANVGALLLARGVQRRREMAVRTALGASRWDAMRLPLAESLLITVLGSVLGLASAAGGVRTIGALAATRMPQLEGLGVDWRVILFSLALAIVVAIACVAVPAWRGATVDPQDALRGGRSSGGSRDQHRMLRSLVVLEIGLSLMLLIGAGLVLKGFARLLDKDPGFDPVPILTLRLTASQARYANANVVRTFLEPVLDGIAAVPGVEAAGSINLVPYVSWGWNGNIRYEGHQTDDPTRLPLVEYRTATPGFFAVTKQRLLAGRFLKLSDDENAPPVVVVNQALVDRDLKGQSPVGARFLISDTSFATIVGVVSNIRNTGPVAPPAAEMYWPVRSAGQGQSDFPVVVRVKRGAPTAVVGAIRDVVRRIDPTAAVAAVRPMNEVIANSLGQPRFYFSLLGAFAAVALFLALAGLYGVLSYVVAQRTRELGIRAALGSSTGSLLRLVMLDGLGLVAGGIVIGLAAGATVTRLMVFMLYGVSPLDGSTWAIAALLMACAGLVATLVPAARATRADPMMAIRAE
jgi:putative ABC transport system permease protein